MKMTRTLTRALLAVFCAGALLTACREQPEDQQTGSMSSEDVKAVRAAWPEGVSAAIDSGNAAFSAKTYDAARTHYQEALRLAGEDVKARTTAYFGLYMVEQAVGNTAAADSAMAAARALSPEASLMHGTPAAAPDDSLHRTAPRTPDDSIHRRPRN